MVGNKIVVQGNPNGRWEEIVVAGTPKPGQFMGIKGSVAPVGGNPTSAGRFTYEEAGATAASGSRGMNADGDRIAVGILCGPGETAATVPTTSPAGFTYAAGDRASIYWPCNGDLLNVLYQNQSGTADDVAVGDKGIVDDGTGKILVSTGSVESEPVEFREALVDPTADALLLAVWCGM